MGRPRRISGVYQRGGVWWIRYQHRGKQVREPGGFDGRGARTKTEAEEKLKHRLGEMTSDRYIGPKAERVTVGMLLDAYLAHLETRAARSVAQIRSQCKPVREFFGAERAIEVTSDRLREFIAERLDDCKPATVNRSLQAFRAAFHLARKEERLSRVPFFPLLTEDNARTGFFERAEHEAVKKHLPDPYNDLAEFGYRTGWRRGEIEPLQWSDVDRDTGQVRLRTSKNGEPRTFPLRDQDGELTDLGELIEKRWRLRAYRTKDGQAVSVLVFHAQGRRVWDFSKRWKAATTSAKLPGRLFHDYRRTAARDLIRSGVPQSIAMSMTGHKTDAVFRRYNITDDRDKQEAVAKVTAYRATRPKAANVVPLAQGQA